MHLPDYRCNTRPKREASVRETRHKWSVFCRSLFPTYVAPFSRSASNQLRGAHVDKQKLLSCSYAAATLHPPGILSLARWIRSTISTYCLETRFNIVPSTSRSFRCSVPFSFSDEGWCAFLMSPSVIMFGEDGVYTGWEGPHYVPVASVHQNNVLPSSRCWMKCCSVQHLATHSSKVIRLAERTSFVIHLSLTFFKSTFEWRHNAPYDRCLTSLSYDAVVIMYVTSFNNVKHCILPTLFCVCVCGPWSVCVSQ